MYMYVFVCVCVCARARARKEDLDQVQDVRDQLALELEREREREEREKETCEEEGDAGPPCVRRRHVSVCTHARAHAHTRHSMFFTCVRARVWTCSSGASRWRGGVSCVCVCVCVCARARARVYACACVRRVRVCTCLSRGESVARDGEMLTSMSHGFSLQRERESE
jgi:hypothetical protein